MDVKQNFAHLSQAQPTREDPLDYHPSHHIQQQRLQIMRQQQQQQLQQDLVDQQKNELDHMDAFLGGGGQTNEIAKKYPCQIKNCNKSYSTKGGLDYHLEKTHGFTQHNNKSNHNKSMDFRCQFEGCNKSYTSKYGLEYHLKKHNNDMKYVCYCGKRFITKGHMQYHSKVHPPTINKCPYCDQSFAVVETLLEHLKTHPEF